MVKLEGRLQLPLIDNISWSKSIAGDFNRPSDATQKSQIFDILFIRIYKIHFATFNIIDTRHDGQFATFDLTPQYCARIFYFCQ